MDNSLKSFPQLNSVKEAAKRLKVSEALIRKWVYEGRVKPIRLGRRVFLSDEELIRVIEAGKS